MKWKVETLTLVFQQLNQQVKSKWDIQLSDWQKIIPESKESIFGVVMLAVISIWIL